MNPLLRRASLRYLLEHRVQSLLALLGIAVGVAAWVSVQGASQAAQTAFRVSTQQAFGIASHQLLPHDRLLEASLYGELRRRLPQVPAAPVLAGRVFVERGGERRSLELLGIDPLAEAELRIDGVAPGVAGAPALAGMVGNPAAVVLPAALASAWALGPGDQLAVSHAGRRHLLEVYAVVPEALLPLGEDTLLVDIAAAERVLDSAGWLSRVDLLLDTGQAAWLADTLPPGVDLVATAARSQAVADMTRAYRLNLLALTLLTLLVGLLLVYSTMTHLVAQRGELFVRLQALGLDTPELRRLVLGEAVVLGLAGGALGALGGWWLAGQLVGLVAGNISDLYFRVSVESLALQPGVLLSGVFLGVAAAALGGLVPALQISARRPAQHRSLSVELLAALLAAVAGASVLLASDGVVGGFAGLFLVACAGVLLVPAALEILVGIALRLPGVRGQLLARMTLRDSVAGLARTRIALAGLALAVATVIALDLMVANFRASVAEWMEGAIVGEFVVSADSAVYPDVRDAPLEALAVRVARLPGVEAVAGIRFLRLRDGADSLLLRAADHPRGVPGLVAGAAGDAFERGDGVLVSEPLALRRGLAPGDLLPLAFPAGPQTLPVLGVYRDYLSDRGVVLISRSGLARWNDEALPGSFSVLAAQPDAVRADLERLVAETPGVTLAEAGALRARTLEIFDRTFVVTGVLKLLVGGAAMLGMLGALLAWLLDRAALRRSLRALGLDWNALRRLFLLETGALGLATVLVALPLGTVLAGLLVFVINRRAFGWSMQFEPLALPLLQGGALALAAALLAGGLAAWSLGRAAPKGLPPARLPAALVAVGAVLLAGCQPPAERQAPETVLDAAALLAGDAAEAGFATVTGPRPLVFPEDHGEHPTYRLEWWYFTAVLRDGSGRRFGMQYTLFRFALAPGDELGSAAGWNSRQVYMAHLAVTHEVLGQHRHAERFGRPGGGVAGVVAAPFSAWLQDWRLHSTGEDFLPLALAAADPEWGVELEFAPGRGPVLHGDAGYSRKGRDVWNASRYFSYTRLPTRGVLIWDGERIEVEGLTWMDREWGSSVLEPEVSGWDWLSLRLEDGRDLMLFQLRRHDGGVSEFGAGSLVNPDGSVRRINQQEFTMLPLEVWRSPATGASYPVRWQVTLPGEQLAFTLAAVIPDQEMRTRVRYWEGLVDARDGLGRRLGEGFLELTGY